MLKKWSLLYINDPMAWTKKPRSIDSNQSAMGLFGLLIFMIIDWLGLAIFLLNEVGLD